MTGKLSYEKASEIAKNELIREKILGLQKSFFKPPGLVADGRDMGTVVFPEAKVKIFLTASIEERASRRYKQLLEQGENVSLPALVEQVRSRDERDMTRESSPLRPAAGAINIDTSSLSIQEVTDTVLNLLTVKGFSTHS